jgi:predicted porin
VVYGASLFYAPSIVAFGDADQMYEFEMRVEYELLPTANVYLGYRSIKADIKNRKDITVDESAVVGLRFKF